jgi:AcrR family transcriptional regulator
MEVESMAAYSSKLRSAQAAATRARVIAAAAECFIANGYSATTLRAIADRAGVSVETVQSTGVKRALLIAAFDQIYTGDASEQHFAERAEVVHILGDPDTAAALRRIARWIADNNARVAGLWRIITAAATNDPDVAAYHREHLVRMRDQTADIVNGLVERGLIAPERSVQETADLIWNSQLPDVRSRLVVDAGWAHDSYADWLGETFVDLCRPGISAKSPRKK